MIMPVVRLAFALLIGSATLAAQSDLPVSYVYPMSEHSEVVETRPGKWLLCQMVLVPVRIDLAWSCSTLDARIASPVLPLKLSVKLKFEPNRSDERFDFTFAEYSKEPASVAPSPQAAQPRPAQAPAATTPAPPPLLSGVPASMPVPIERFSEMLPGTSVALLALLDARSDEVRALIEKGDFGAVYVPALVSKEIALALEGHLAELPDTRRLQGTNAVRRLVLAAWQLDFFGDLGNRERLTAVQVRFSGAVTDLKTAFAR